MTLTTDSSGVPFRERLFCSVKDAVTASGIGRSSLYKEMRRGALEFRKHGKRTLVSVPSLMKLLDDHSDAGAGPAA